jgi:hypothetical protein
VREENREYLAKVDDQVEGNAELTSMLHTLEERYDSYMAGSNLAQPIIHTGDLPSADELAAELERFLADRTDDRGRRPPGDDWRANRRGALAQRPRDMDAGILTDCCARSSDGVCDNGSDPLSTASAPRGART